MCNYFNFCPHSGQNFAFPESFAPHFGHTDCVGVPHSGQNFAPGVSFAPHFAQIPPPAASSMRAPQRVQNFESAGTCVPHFGHAFVAAADFPILRCV